MKISKGYLGEVINIIMGQAPPGTECNKNGIGTPFVKAGEFGNERPIIREWTTKPLRLAKRSDTLLCVVGATSGKVNKGEDCAIGRSVAALRVKSDALDENYLYRYISSWTERLRAKSQGAAQTVINKEMIASLEIPLPPLSTQQQIARILDQADALRKKTQQVIDLYDQLAQSIFLDMFGDPVRNPKGFSKGVIRDLVSEVKYGTSSKSDSEGDYAYLRMNNITYSGHMNYKDLKYISLDQKELSKYSVKKGDLLFNRTNSKELVGKTAIYNRNEVMVIAGYIIRVRMNSKGNPYYVWAYLNSRHGKLVLKNMCKNIVGMANINAQELQDIKILLPPLTLQNQFAEKISLIEKQKELAKQSLQESENLFNALLQKAFKGELVNSV